MSDFCIFWLQFLLKNHYLKWIIEESPKIKIYYFERLGRGQGTIFKKIFGGSGGVCINHCPQPTIIAYYIIFIIFPIVPPPKLKKSLKKLHFFSNFLNRFSNFLNFHAYFWKITIHFRALPNITISSQPSKIGPPKHLADPLNRKILHKLLVTMQ